MIKNKIYNLYQFNLQKTYSFDIIYKKRATYLKTYIQSFQKNTTFINLYNHAEILYHKGYCALDLIQYIKQNIETDLKTSKFIFLFNQIKLEVRNEILLIYYILYFLSYNLSLENLILM